MIQATVLAFAAVGGAGIEVVRTARGVHADEQDAGVYGTEQSIITVAVGKTLRGGAHRYGGQQRDAQREGRTPPRPHCQPCDEPCSEVRDIGKPTLRVQR
jgi:hypothetical protein